MAPSGTRRQKKEPLPPSLRVLLRAIAPSRSPLFSSFILHPSSFILHPSSFILHPSSQAGSSSSHAAPRLGFQIPPTPPAIRAARTTAPPAFAHCTTAIAARPPAIARSIARPPAIISTRSPAPDAIPPPPSRATATPAHAPTRSNAA